MNVIKILLVAECIIADPVCDNEYEAIQGKCVKVTCVTRDRDRVSWHQARDICISQGATLTAPVNDEMNSYIGQQVIQL